jgi:hypothetical protein
VRFGAVSSYGEEGRLDLQGRVDPPGLERRVHLGEGHFHVLDLRVVRARLVHRLVHHERADVVERVDGHRRALEVLGLLDLAALGHDDPVPRVVGPGAGQHPLRYDLHGQVLRGRDDQRRHVREADLVVAGYDSGHDRCAAFGELRLDLEVLLLEEALLHTEVERSDVGDRDDPDLERRDLVARTTAAATVVVIAAGADEQRAGEHEHQPPSEHVLLPKIELGGITSDYLSLSQTNPT